MSGSTIIKRNVQNYYTAINLIPFVYNTFFFPFIMTNKKLYLWSLICHFYYTDLNTNRPSQQKTIYSKLAEHE